MKNFNKHCHLLKFVQVAIFVLILLASCSKEEQPKVKSNLNSISSFSFSKTENPLLTVEAVGVIADRTIFITLPDGISLNSLTPRFSISSAATISYSGALIESGKRQLNFSETVTLRVTAESGRTADYKILVKNGENAFDQVLYAFMQKYSIPGISYAITEDEEIVYKSGLGFAVTETDTRTTPSHLYRLASVSKQFTSLCIMKLMERGKLTLDQKVFGTSGILASEFTGVTERAASVTIRHLLEHTSGWTSDPDPMFTSSFSGQSLSQRIDYVLKSTQKEPGTSFSYYNMGFGILGKVIEKVSGKGYEAFLKEVLAEAGVTDIHVGGDRSQRRANEVVYYSQDGMNGYGNPMDVIAAAGGVIASVEEMMKLMFHIDGRGKIGDIITPSTRTTMLTPSSVYNRYALGWRCNHSSLFSGSWYHSGNLAGTASMWVMGGDGINCVVLCNSRSYISGFDDEMYVMLNDLLRMASSTTW
jgi:CubicO group peptidase (beta-lactamase class C family)